MRITDVIGVWGHVVEIDVYNFIYLATLSFYGV
jgi:hypothetical protein